MSEHKTGPSKDASTAVRHKYDTTWQNIDREGSLINQRITWAVVFSSGLFVTTGFLANVAADQNALLLRSLILALMIVVAVLGFLFSLDVREGVRAAQNQAEYLKEYYTSNEALFQVEHGLPRPFGDMRDNASGNKAATVFPIHMMVVWGIAATVEFAFLVSSLSTFFRSP